MLNKVFFFENQLFLPNFGHLGLVAKSYIELCIIVIPRLFLGPVLHHQILDLVWLHANVVGPLQAQRVDALLVVYHIFYRVVGDFGVLLVKFVFHFVFI